MIYDALSVRKTHVGNLLKTIRKINAIQIVSKNVLLQGLHTTSSEPYFYDTGYKSSALKQVTVVDHDKRCLFTQEKFPGVDEYALCNMSFLWMKEGIAFCLNKLMKKKTGDNCPKKWKCTNLCNALTDQEIVEIMNIKTVFERPLEEVRAFLHEIDSGCPLGHYTKVIQNESHDNKGEYTEQEMELMGHPIQCAAGMCQSPLRLL